MGIQGPGGLIPRVRFRLLAADLLAGLGGRTQARQQLDQAVTDLDTGRSSRGAGSSYAPAPRRRARLIGGLAPDRDLIAAGMRALDCERRVSKAPTC